MQKLLMSAALLAALTLGATSLRVAAAQQTFMTKGCMLSSAMGARASETSCLNACAPNGKPTRCRISAKPTAAERACSLAMNRRDAHACYAACMKSGAHGMCKSPSACPLPNSMMRGGG